MKHGASCSLGNKREVPFLPAHKDYVAPWIFNAVAWLVVVILMMMIDNDDGDIECGCSFVTRLRIEWLA